MHSQDPNTIALFGPQVTRWTQESLSSLQSKLLLDPNLKFIKESLAELPSLRPTIEKLNFSSHESLQQLSDFATGKRIPDEKSLNNTHLAPLTIVDHVVQFVQMAEERNMELPKFRAAQGFCIGFLSATAISSSSSWAEFKINTSNALRVAACIGAIIDSEDASHTGATAVSVRWKTDSDRTYLESTLDLFPEVSGVRFGP